MSRTRADSSSSTALIKNKVSEEKVKAICYHPYQDTFLELHPWLDEIDWTTTLNKTGFNQPPSTPSDEELLETIRKNPKARILDIAAGKGCLTLRIFAIPGATPIVCAIDLSVEHLNICIQYIKEHFSHVKITVIEEKESSTESKESLTVEFIDLEKILKDNVSEDEAVFIAVVRDIHFVKFNKNFFHIIADRNFSHFNPGKKLKELYEEYYDWLVPGGMLFSSGNAPYTKLNQDSGILADFERKKEEGNPFPGEVHNFSSAIRLINTKVADMLPEFMQFLDPEILLLISVAAGFVAFRGTYSGLPFFNSVHKPIAAGAAKLVRLDPSNQNDGKIYFSTVQMKPGPKSF